MTDNMINPELADIEISGMTRSSFLVKGTLAAGAVYGATMVGPLVGRAMAQGAVTDVDILNYALTLEYLESAFYAKGIKDGHLSGDALKFAKEFGSEEDQHVTALTQAVRSLKGKPAARPMFVFPFTNEASFLKLADTLENTGVSAYNGAAPMISDVAILAAAGSIVQIEARHAAIISLLLNESPAPNAFDKPLPMKTVVKAITPLIK